MITLTTSSQLQRMIASVLKQLFKTNFFLVFFGGGGERRKTSLTTARRHFSCLMMFSKGCYSVEDKGLEVSPKETEAKEDAQTRALLARF